MNLVGKIMIVLILVMSILFMGFALAVYSTHQNWRESADNLKQEGGQLRAKKAQLENKIAQLQNEIEFERAARREAIANLVTRENQKNQELLRRDQDYANVQDQFRQALETVKTSQARLDALSKEVDSLRESNRIARKERNEAFMMSKQLTDAINQGEGDLRRMKQRNMELLQQNGRQQLVLDRNGLSEFSPVDDIAPKVEGQVTRIVDGLVEVSIGADEGLQEGHQLKIFRLSGNVGSYLASIEIVDTNSDRAVGRIVPGTREGIIRKGDRVATKIL